MSRQRGASAIRVVLEDGFTIKQLRAVLAEIGGDENSNLDVSMAYVELRRREALKSANWFVTEEAREK
jgi:hypothetical protein